jgi:hypothetical protein
MPAARAALLPHPPLLVPDLAGAAAAELDPLRAACREALASVLAARPALVVLGDGPVWGLASPWAVGSFAPYGADVEVALPGSPLPLDLPGLPEPARLEELPLSLSVAAWLLGSLGVGQLAAATVPAALGPAAAAAVGKELARAAGAAGPVGVVAMGDLSARRTRGAPGWFHPAAAGFDAGVARALARGDLGALAALDPARAAELMAAGRPVLQALAGALAGARRVHGRILYDDAPYGVGYVVATLAVAAGTPAGGVGGGTPAGGVGGEAAP